MAGGMVFLVIACGTKCLQGLDEKVRSPPGYAGRACWQIGLTTAKCTQSGAVVPVTHVILDFDMAGRDKCFDFVGSAGTRSVLETTLGLESQD